VTAYGLPLAGQSQVVCPLDTRMGVRWECFNGAVAPEAA
jgi:hypothetical protein